jgi:glucose/arabinose dehydrogenase
MHVSAAAPHRPFVPCLLLSAALVMASPMVVPAPAQPDAPIGDPIPAEPIVSGLALILEEFVTIPPSQPNEPPTDPRLIRWARINYLGEVPDGSRRLFVPDLNGKLYLIEAGVAREYLDVGAEFSRDFWSHRGLGSGFGFVTFHPEFAENGKFYTVHSEARDALATRTPDLPPQDTTVVHGVLTEWTADDPSASTFSGTRREVLRLAFATFIHGFQEINFNPTAEPGDEDYGLLYVSVGEGGVGWSTDDPQNLTRPHGKILRIDPQGTNGANGQYGIPATNPFVGRPGALGEIYAYGLRNPHRFSWDPGARNRMFVGNIGEHNIESIYEVEAGANFGWSKREGPFLFKKEDRCHVYPLPEDDDQFGYTYPVAAYDHDPPADWPCGRDTGDAVIGGFVYRGERLPRLTGKYVFGDDVNGRIFYTNAGEMRPRKPNLANIYEFMLFDTRAQRVTMQELAGDPRVDLRFGRDADGELYVLSKANGKIWRVAGARQFAGCDPGQAVTRDVMGAENWQPVTPEKWQFPGTEVILAEPGVSRPGPRRPFEYAVLTTGPEFGSVQIDGEVRIDTPVEISNRDVIIVFGYRSDTEFYYAHLSTDNTIYPHNGIFVVNNADRLRIEDQWDGSTGAPPAIPDKEWHKVRVTHCADSGEIAVYVDGAKAPLMTATDTTFNSGRVGFGSFDNIGRLRNLTVTGTTRGPDVLPSLMHNLVAYYDFERPVPGNAAQEEDQGFSGTNIDLVNGGAAMRVPDGAYSSSTFSLQTQQVDPSVAGNNDWKAGMYSGTGVATLNAFNGVKEVTIMGWFKMTGPNPSPNSTTADPNDFFGAVGLAGILSGDSDGHQVRALLEVINLSGTLRLVALGRRIDGSSSQTFAANEDWRTLLPHDEWVFLGATFDFNHGTMGLYKNGQPLDGFYTLPGDPWEVIGGTEPDVTSATDPRGIKIGGSFPQNTRETNPCNCRMDSLMFLNRAVTRGEMLRQYRLMTAQRP